MVSLLIRVLSAGCAYLLGSTGLGNGQRDTEDGVGAKLGLVGGGIEVDEELVNLGLVLDVNVGLDQLRANDGVDVLDGLGDTLAGPLGLVTIAELASLVLAWEESLLVIETARIRSNLDCTHQWKLPRGQWHGGGRSR